MSEVKLGVDGGCRVVVVVWWMGLDALVGGEVGGVEMYSRLAG